MESNITCKSLGYEYAQETVNNGSDYGTETELLIANLRCYGNETFLQECPHSPWGAGSNQSDCVPASVSCKGDSYEVRLFGGVSGRIGFVEIQYSGVWGSICIQGFTYKDAQVCTYSRTLIIRTPSGNIVSQTPYVLIRVLLYLDNKYI